MRRISNFLRGRAASLRVTTGRPTLPAISRTRSQSAASQTATKPCSAATTPTRQKAAEAALLPAEGLQLKVRLCLIEHERTICLQVTCGL